MSSIREGVITALNTFQRTQTIALPIRGGCRYATEAGTVAAAAPAAIVPTSFISQLESSSSLAMPMPRDRKSQRQIRRFNPRGRAMARRYELPGTRFQYHPPKYDRGKFHPVQPLPSSEPTSRQFVPGPFNIPRLKHTYQDTITHDILTLAYTHKVPGEPERPIPRKFEDRLKTWDDSSPYHKNRGHARPRRGDKLPLMEKPIDFTNIPEIESVALSCYIRDANKNRDAWVAGWTALRAICGRSPWNIRTKKPQQQWHTQRNGLAGVHSVLKSDMAYEFIDRLLTFVLPRIKDWPGQPATTGDKNGNIQLGLRPQWLAYFPEIAVNYDMYPVTMIPGLRISINTTGKTNRQARLLMMALGLPLTGRLKN
ncbi:54S ribosomal protein L7 [Zalerion maritima]|uniref:54S ribosomal protein L7 n=1 Tax=Zalerion maritima TaxID=339359 RepID=A0AAD5RS09_9PEZI|nr:54S ribosomal protein L7 [Zalerion maritima]